MTRFSRARGNPSTEVCNFATNGQRFALCGVMVSYPDYHEQYANASLALTKAISEMAESVDTPDFNRAFWKVQRASSQCKRVREAAEQLQASFSEASVILT